NAAVADHDIDVLARGSRAVEEKTAADQDVMARAQVATGPLSSTPLPSGLLLGGKLRPCVLRSGSALPPGYEPITLYLRLAPPFEPKSVHARLRELWPTACGRDGNDRPARTRRARGCDRGRRPSIGNRIFPAPGAKPGCSPARRPPPRRN